MTLAERYTQLRIVQGPDTAREFAIREVWTLTRQGVSLEAISQQFDLPVADVEALVEEARSRAVARIDAYDPRVSLSAALVDIETARKEALRVLNTQQAPSARAVARRQLLECSRAELDLCQTIRAFKNETGGTQEDKLSAVTEAFIRHVRATQTQAHQGGGEL